MKAYDLQRFYRVALCAATCAAIGAVRRPCVQYFTRSRSARPWEERTICSVRAAQGATPLLHRV